MQYFNIPLSENFSLGNYLKSGKFLFVAGVSIVMFFSSYGVYAAEGNIRADNVMTGNGGRGSAQITCSVSDRSSPPWDTNNPEYSRYKESNTAIGIQIDCGNGGVGGTTEFFPRNINAYSLTSQCRYASPGEYKPTCTVWDGGTVIGPAPAPRTFYTGFTRVNFPVKCPEMPYCIPGTTPVRTGTGTNGCPMYSCQTPLEQCIKERNMVNCPIGTTRIQTSTGSNGCPVYECRGNTGAVSCEIPICSTGTSLVRTGTGTNGCPTYECQRTLCTTEYNPVCGQPLMPECLPGLNCPDVMPNPKTYSNSCTMQQEGATFLHAGACKCDPKTCPTGTIPVQTGTGTNDCPTYECRPIDSEKCFSKVTNIIPMCEGENGKMSITLDNVCQSGKKTAHISFPMNHAGWVEIPGYVTRAENMYFKGCGCPEPLLTTQKIIGISNNPLYSATAFLYPDKDGIPDRCYAEAKCGNGKIEGNEECDLGSLNGLPTSFCDSGCRMRTKADPLCSLSASGYLTEPLTRGFCSIGTATGFQSIYDGETYTSLYSWNCTYTGSTSTIRSIVSDGNEIPTRNCQRSPSCGSGLVAIMSPDGCYSCMPYGPACTEPVVTSGSITPIRGKWGKPLSYGQFSLNGNAGFIDLNLAPVSNNINTYYNTTVIGNRIVGWFWLQSVGWVSFGSCLPTEIIPIAGNASGGTLSGYAWSQNAGWIEFQKRGTAARVTFDAVSRSLGGYAWNNGIGWVHFQGSGTGNPYPSVSCQAKYSLYCKGPDCTICSGSGCNGCVGPDCVTCKGKDCSPCSGSDRCLPCTDPNACNLCRGADCKMPLCTGKDCQCTGSDCQCTSTGCTCKGPSCNCTGSGCRAVCGDGVRNGSEQCDPSDYERRINWGIFGCSPTCIRRDCTGPSCEQYCNGPDCHVCKGTSCKGCNGPDCVTCTGPDCKACITANPSCKTCTGPGCDIVNCTGPHCVDRTPGGYVYCFGVLEVMRDGVWRNNGVEYGKEERYRVNTTCNESSRLEMVGSPSTHSGRVITSTVFTPISPTTSGGAGTFTATIERDQATNTRGNLQVYMKYMHPDGHIQQNVPEIWAPPDAPLSIDTKRGGVRVIGSAYGSGIGENTDFYNSLSSRIRRNVAELTRGMNIGTVTNQILVLDGDTDYGDIPSLDSFKTLIIRGGNLTIGSDISSLKGIIVLKDAAGKGGNVIIGDTVESIHAIIFAEGVLRGKKSIYGEENADLQIVLHGALYSRNTIGGSDDTGNLYLYNKQSTTNQNEAFLADLNNVRSGNGGKLYAGYDESLIIEYNPSILQNPPPGF